MKFLLAISLLLITAVYVFPVKEVIKKSASVSLTDSPEEKEESSNKEKFKEFIFEAQPGTSFSLVLREKYLHHTVNLPIRFSIEETPPPDNNG